MRLVILSLVGFTCFSPALHAQREPDKVACYADKQDNAPHKKKLWDGYEISLGPSGDPNAVEQKCTATIYSSAGRVVFRTNGYSVLFDEEQTGKDLTEMESPRWCSVPIPEGECIAAGGTSVFRFRRNHLNSSTLQWSAPSPLRTL